MTIRRIGVLTGGGDVPGLNACIKIVTLQAHELGWDVVDFRGGYHGMLHYNPDDPDGGVDIAAVYDRADYRPRISGILGMPMFLC